MSQCCVFVWEQKIEDKDRLFWDKKLSIIYTICTSIENVMYPKIYKHGMKKCGSPIELMVLHNVIILIQLNI